MSDKRSNKPWQPFREENELHVYCRRCNGYLHSTDRFTAGRDDDFAIECPRMVAGKCAYGGTR